MKPVVKKRYIVPVLAVGVFFAPWVVLKRPVVDLHITTVNEVSGTATVVRASGETEPAAPGLTLAPGDHVAIDSGATLTLQTSTDLIRLDQNTRDTWVAPPPQPAFTRYAPAPEHEPTVASIHATNLDHAADLIRQASSPESAPVQMLAPVHAMVPPFTPAPPFPTTEFPATSIPTLHQAIPVGLPASGIGNPN